MTPQTLLLTGATGFIGAHVLRKLQEPSFKKKYRVLCLVRRPISAPYILGSLEDKQLLLQATKNVDAVIHLAGETRSSQQTLNYTANVLGTKNLLEACEQNKIKRFIFGGTVNADLNKRGVYGESKKQAETLVKESRLDAVILKFNMVYGPGDSNLSKTIKLMKKLPFVPVIGHGNIALQPVYVDDVVDVILRCLTIKKFKHRVYSLAGPYSFTFNAYADMLLQALHLKRIKLHIPRFFVHLLVVCTGNLFADIINLELVYSITQNKNVDIRPAQRDLSFKPREFRATLQKLLHT